MGADLRISGTAERHGEPVGDLMVHHSQLHGTRVRGDMVVRMIDEFPVFAVAAAYAQGRTIVEQADELRHKESDRIASLGQELAALGVRFMETPDGFVVEGGQLLCGGIVQSHGDHRLAMALSVAGLAAQAAVTVREAGIISESYPQFDAALRSLGGDVQREAQETA
jgi:3-phosphoshikimate 1-carboxyvinyltransferase